MKKIIMIMAMLSCVSVVYAAPEKAMGNRSMVNQQMEQDIFNRFKQIRIEGIQQRISISQTALSCVQGAQKKEEMMACDEAERNAMKNLEQSQQQKLQALRQSMQQAHQQMQQNHKGQPNQPGQR